MTSFRGKILVIRGGAIGDFILTLPAITALRKAFPDAYLEVLGYPHIVQLAVEGGLVDRATPIEARALAGFFALGGVLEEGLADYFSEFDLIVSYLYDPDTIFETNVRRCTTAQFLTGPHRPNEEAGTPAARVFLKPLEHLAIFDADDVPRLSLKHAASATNCVAMHPGSGSERKNWPESFWAGLLAAVVNGTDKNLLLVGGEAEGERLQRLAATLPPMRTRVAQSLPLTELAALLMRSTVFVGHDSGVSHLASALGLRCLLLWGDSQADVWRPPGQNVTIIHRTQGTAALPPEWIFHHLQDILPP